MAVSETVTAGSKFHSELESAEFTSLIVFFRACQLGLDMSSQRFVHPNHQNFVSVCLPVGVCLSCSRRTGHYTVQQNQNAHHGDRHGPLANTGNPKTTGTDPPSLPNPRSQPSSSPKPGSSPRHSPNSRPRPQPTYQRCSSQVGCESWDTFVEALSNLGRQPLNRCIYSAPFHKLC